MRLEVWWFVLHQPVQLPYLAPPQPQPQPQPGFPAALFTSAPCASAGWPRAGHASRAGGEREQWQPAVSLLSPHIPLPQLPTTPHHTSHGRETFPMSLLLQRLHSSQSPQSPHEKETWTLAPDFNPLSRKLTPFTPDIIFTDISRSTSNNECCCCSITLLHNSSPTRNRPATAGTSS
ncbi:hypothetical protein Pcinc_002083 [Petrolisthes cinctipes]|uniref:Uncharacterized protein n=1 Tax=Petrolisthes cinctipes TaxID=88211 RepID=A0AAE1L3W6_PETCI|nr:hypothetical protein Pcinc_022302 [Petrolisthes cinctipes]KAK3894142.1 hypothetical protein Pcinc_002083 [Petrolisthes cinctipes]